jgi:hypothetical protein
MTQRERHTYDHRVNAQVIAARNPDLFAELEIPRSTALSWIRRGFGKLVSLDVERARQSMPLASALRVLGLSAGRYYDWVGRLEACSLDDRASCLRSKPVPLDSQAG